MGIANGKINSTWESKFKWDDKTRTHPPYGF